MEKKLFDILQERGYVKDLTHENEIKEIFSSIQGEGPFIGYKQLFVRFCGCNLSCEYCDTDFSEIDSKKYSVDSLLNIAKNSKNENFRDFRLKSII